jgi:hypothetical protein
MERMQSEPFNLKGGDLIMFRAQALNADGWSPWSQPSKRASAIMRTPQAPSQPRHKWNNSRQTSATISWNRNNNPLHAGIFEGTVRYILFWDQGTPDGQSKDWVELTETIDTFTTVPNIVHGQ